MSDDGTALRLAYLTPEFVTEPKFDGGLANYLSRVTVLLQQAGHEPEIFVLSDRDEDTNHQGVLVHRVKQQIRRRDRTVQRIFNRMARIKLHAAAAVWSGARCLAEALLRRHQERPFDLVQGSDYGATGLFVPRRRDFPFVTRLSYYRPLVRELSGLQPNIDARCAERLERLSVQRSDSCFGPSGRIASVVQQAMRVTVEVIPPPVPGQNGVIQDDESVLLREIGNRPFVLFFGRVCRIKGVDLLAEAMQPILSDDPTLHLVVVGREDPPGMIDDMRERLGDAAGRLIPISRIAHSQLFPIIRQARGVVLPSRIDNFPNACIEAMQAGQIVVGTKEASFDEMIVDGQSGFLCSSGSVRSISNAIRRVLELTSEQRQAVSTAARLKMQEFSPDITIPRLCDYYRRAILAHRN